MMNKKTFNLPLTSSSNNTTITSISSNGSGRNLEEFLSEIERPIELESSLEKRTIAADSHPDVKINEQIQSNSKFPSNFSVKNSTRIIINVGGKKFEIFKHYLLRSPETRLGLIASSNSEEKIKELCDDFIIPETKEIIENNDQNDKPFLEKSAGNCFTRPVEMYYFDRDHKNFKMIINYYRTGKLHTKGDFCPVQLQEDFDYWGLDIVCKLSFLWSI